jgi:formylglycine-generating enzyme required for sulfatase activity
MGNGVLLIVLSLILQLFIAADTNRLLKNYTKVSEKTYLYNFEVSVGEYYQFLKAKKYHIDLLPDTSIFNDTVTFGNQIIPLGFSKEYFSAKYKDYPIIGITTNQAEQYCEWLLYSKTIEGSNIKEIRLPTVSEYFSTLYNNPLTVEFREDDDCKFILTNSSDENHWTDLCFFDLSKTIANGRFIENLSGVQDGYVHLCPVKAYSNEMNNLLGNVSELVYSRHKGSLIIPVGNNFSGNVSYMGKLYNPSYLTWDENLISLKNSSARIGFRYVIVLK